VSRLTLHPVSPNPFNPTTTVSFSLPVAGTIDLSVYDVSGRLVTTLARGLRAAGPHRETWDGTDASGLAVGSGVYFVRLSAAGETATTKMVLMK